MYTGTKTVSKPIKVLPITKRKKVFGKFRAQLVSQDTRITREKFGAGSLIVRCGGFCYNVTEAPEIYEEASSKYSGFNGHILIHDDIEKMESHA